MPTLRDVAREIELRRERLDAAEAHGYADDAEAARQWVSEIEFAFVGMVTPRLAALVEAAGDVELGPMPVGMGLILVEQEEAQERAMESASPSR